MKTIQTLIAATAMTLTVNVNAMNIFLDDYIQDDIIAAEAQAEVAQQIAEAKQAEEAKQNAKYLSAENERGYFIKKVNSSSSSTSPARATTGI